MGGNIRIRRHRGWRNILQAAPRSSFAQDKWSPRRQSTSQQTKASASAILPQFHQSINYNCETKAFSTKGLSLGKSRSNMETDGAHIACTAFQELHHSSYRIIWDQFHQHCLFPQQSLKQGEPLLEARAGVHFQYRAKHSIPKLNSTCLNNLE